MVIVLELLEFMILHLCFYSNCSAVHCIIYKHVSRCKFNIFYDKKFDCVASKNTWRLSTQINCMDF